MRLPSTRIRIIMSLCTSKGVNGFDAGEGGMCARKKILAGLSDMVDTCYSFFVCGYKVGTG